MKKEIKSDPPEDIPAWFMTYSDVITLLMTFFILLLTFATTEPDRFEKVTPSLFGSSGATGVAGRKHDKLDRNSWSERIRPRAARIALNGSEMPPIQTDMVQAPKGAGIKKATEEEKKKDVMNSYSFTLPIADLVNENSNLTRKGTQLMATLSSQLRSLPVHCAIEIANPPSARHATSIAHHLYHVQKARPGQVGVGFNKELDSNSVRIVIERYEP